MYKNHFTRVVLSFFFFFNFSISVTVIVLSVLKSTEDRNTFKVRHQSLELRENALN